jgi:pimeloyl-ACP methyl ester carboxylesterase
MRGLAPVRWSILALWLLPALSAVCVHAADVAARSGGARQIGQLSFEACEIGGNAASGTLHAWCTHFDVPEDWEQPQGRHIALRVAVVESTSAQAADDLVVFLDGGPGGAATEDFVAYAPAFAELNRRHRILLVDQRGTGGSNPLRCEASDQEQEAAVVGADNRVDRAVVQAQLRRCLMVLAGRADPRHYTTTAAVRDLEAVRQALGAPRLDLVGVSYGTRVAQQYATRHAAAVRSIVLDSAVPNTLVLGSEHARNLENALQSRFAECRATAACRQRFGDPYDSLRRLRERLRGQPQQLRARDPVSFEPVDERLGAAELAGIVRLYAYSAPSAALLPLTIDEALRGHFEPLLGQARLLSDALVEQLTDGAGLSVSCAEDADRLRPEPRDADTLLGNTLVDYALAACEIWPRGSRPADFHAPFVTPLPVLVLGGEFDPVTPLRYGQAIVQALPNARLLRAPGQGHAVMSAGCMPRLVAEFVTRPEPRKLDDRCLQRLGSVPAFLDFSGAAP